VRQRAWVRSRDTNILAMARKVSSMWWEVQRKRLLTAALSSAEGKSKKEERWRKRSEVI
jgi:hypothetical protein